jgi:hypothetical protein
LAHYDETVRERGQFVEDLPLSGIRFFQDGVERRDNRHAQFAQQGEDVTARRPSEDPVLMLEADDIHIADVEEVGGALVRCQIAFRKLEANTIGIRVPGRAVIYQNGKTRILATSIRALFTSYLPPRQSALIRSKPA